MATLQCTKCKAGIHYHGEPNGVELIFIESADWEKIKSLRFDSMNIQYINGRATPKLFRTDTIEADFDEWIAKAWRCPECGSIMIFDRHGKVTVTYEEDYKGVDKLEYNNNYAVFDDYQWNKLTDSAIPNSEISNWFNPSYCAIINNSAMLLYDNNRNFVKRYKKIIMEK